MNSFSKLGFCFLQVKVMNRKSLGLDSQKFPGLRDGISSRSRRWDGFGVLDGDLD